MSVTHTDEFEWEIPEPTTNNNAGPRRRSMRFVAQLRTRPGEWAVYTRDWKSSGVTNMGTHHPGTEWTTRGNGNGTWTVYARWVG